MHFLLFILASSVYVRKNRDNFQFKMFLMDLHFLRCSEHDLTVFGKCLSVCLWHKFCCRACSTTKAQNFVKFLSLVASSYRSVMIRFWRISLNWWFYCCFVLLFFLFSKIIVIERFQLLVQRIGQTFPCNVLTVKEGLWYNLHTHNSLRHCFYFKTFWFLDLGFYFMELSKK